ncbi:MAG: hypothetical protein LBR16_08090, partial [Treponema sp.]|nr:hypothetical protein [Treponema sp.]
DEAADADAAKTKAEEARAFLEETAAFAASHKKFAAARAYVLLAEAHTVKKAWPEAEKAWLDAAAAAKGTYLEPVAYFNAGAAAEEADKAEDAIAHYSAALASSAGFPQAARAQFAVGRLEEGRGGTEAAIAAYQALVGKWPEDAVWGNLAHSRLIALEAEEPEAPAEPAADSPLEAPAENPQESAE